MATSPLFVVSVLLIAILALLGLAILFQRRPAWAANPRLQQAIFAVVALGGGVQLGKVVYQPAQHDAAWVVELVLASVVPLAVLLRAFLPRPIRSPNQVTA